MILTFTDDRQKHAVRHKQDRGSLHRACHNEAASCETVNQSCKRSAAAEDSLGVTFALERDAVLF